jgi:hypothetical protein
LLLPAFLPVLKAQDNFGMPPGRHLTSFRFRMLNGGIILVKARIDTFSDTLNFIFDTGCGSLSLDSSTAVRLRLQPYCSDRYIRGIAGKLPQRLLDGKRLSIGSREGDIILMINGDGRSKSK